MLNACCICWSNNPKISLIAREMLMGTREKFQYEYCPDCESAYLLDKIEDFSKYYPQDYHCFYLNSLPIWKQIALKCVYKYNFYQKWFFWKVVSEVFNRIHGYYPEPAIWWIGHAYRAIWSPGLNTRIIDIWAWWGTLLQQIQHLGFQNISWVEPFWKNSNTSLNISNQTIEDFLKNAQEDSYDIVILSHVFEHLFEQKTVLSWLKKIVKKWWIIVLAMPILWKAYKYYGIDWFPFDAPRHVRLLSEKSFRILTDDVGLDIISTLHEEASWNIFASEVYKKDISFNEIAEFKMKDVDLHKHRELARIFNEQESGWWSVTYFLKSR